MVRNVVLPPLKKNCENGKSTRNSQKSALDEQTSNAFMNFIMLKGSHIRTPFVFGQNEKSKVFQR
jgi:hypothetical protein